MADTAEAVHGLAGKLTVVMLALPAVVAALESVAACDLPDDVRAQLEAARVELEAMAQACHEAVPWITLLRRSVRRLTQDT